MSSNDSDPVGSWSPSKARYEFRTKASWEGKSCSGFCMGHLQANLAVLPSSLADEFEAFCDANRAPCPLLYRSKAGEVSAGSLAQNSDVRSDITTYYVSNNGEITRKTGDLTEYPWDDYVSFYIGCSFTFEDAMVAAEIPIKNLIENRNVAMFETNIPCIPVGPFTCNMVVSMRPIPKELVEKAVVVTAAYDAVHGAPIHIGDPAVIGINDIYNSEFGEPSHIGELIPVFWACGVTSSLAVRSAKPSLSFSHYPGSMFICDTTVDEYFQTHKPEHGDEQPRLVILSHQPFLASVCSVSAWQKIEELARIVQGANTTGSDGEKAILMPNSLLKIAVRLSQAPSVVIGFLHEKESFSSDRSREDCIQGSMALVKALQALGKKITLVTECNASKLNDCLASNVADGILNGTVQVMECDKSSTIKETLFQGGINHRLDTVIALQAAKESPPQSEKGEFSSGVVDKLLEANSCNDGIVRVKITARSGEISGDNVQTNEASAVDSHVITNPSLKAAGYSVAAALYILNKCPVHSRYVRRGLGKRQCFQVEQFLLNAIEEEGFCHQVVQCVTEK